LNRSGRPSKLIRTARGGRRASAGRWLSAVAVFVGLALSAVGRAEPHPVHAARPDGWTLFRGSLEMTGRSEAALPRDLELLWSRKLDDGFESTAAIADGVVYLPSLDGRCHAFDLADGTPIWTFEDPDLASAKSSPCLAEGLVVYGDDAGVLRALRKTDGSLAWRFESQGEIVCSPTVVDGRVLAGSYDNTLYCLDADSGELLWRLAADGPVHCSPSYIDGAVAVAGCDGFLRFVSVEDGKEAASFEIGGQIASTPAVEGEVLFFGTMNETVLAINWKKRGLIWSYRNPERSFPYYSSPAVAEGLVVIGGRDKTLRAFHRHTGNVAWTFRAKARIDSSPVVAGGVVYVGSHDGRVYGVDLQSGERVWEYVLGSATAASPAVADGRLVIASSGGGVFCFGRK